MAMDKIIVKGAREHNLKNVDVTIPRDKLVVFTGLSRVGEILPGLRHHLRRRPATVCGEPFFLRPDVPGADGKARRGLHRGPFPGHLHRPEDHLQKPPVHGGNGNGDLRLPAASLRPDRRAPLPGLRPGDHPADRGPDRGPDSGAAGEDPGPDSGPGDPGAEGRAPVKELENARKSGFVRVRADGILYDLSEEIKLEKNKKHNIEIVVDRLAVSESIKSRLTDSIGDGHPAVRRAGDRRRARRGGDALFPELRLPRPRGLHRGAGAPDVLLQQSLWAPAPPVRGWGRS